MPKTDLTVEQLQKIVATVAQENASRAAQDAVTIAELTIRLQDTQARLQALQAQDGGQA